MGAPKLEDHQLLYMCLESPLKDSILSIANLHEHLLRWALFKIFSLLILKHPIPPF